jgi:hypothetical protein
MIYSLTFTSLTFQRYWTFLQATGSDGNITEDSKNETAAYCDQQDVVLIKTYLIGVVAMQALNILLLLVMIRLSAKGAICDIRARRHVAPLLYLK